MSVLTLVFFLLSAPIVVLGTLKLVYYPLALAHELRRRRPAVFDDPEPLVSVIVPAFDEEVVVGNCVSSLLASGYPRLQVILVDDGSTDGTLSVLRRFEDHPAVTVIAKPNGGKASALNAGIEVATGEILCFCDADGVFTADTIPELLAGFDSRRVGAVCGNDEPANLVGLQTRLLALLTHVGTGFVRRALALINCLPIVSGNLGAFRRSVVEEIGPFAEGFVGEDLELTWRVHRAGYRVAFCPRAKVYAEVPATLRALWKQRVRWARGLIQTARLHSTMIGSPRFGVFGLFLPFNLASMLLLPVLQLASAVTLLVLVGEGQSPVDLDTMSLLGWLGLVLALVAATLSVGLDRAWRDLRLLSVVPLWSFYSLMMTVVTVWALVLEIRGTTARWNKLERSGVVNRHGAAGAHLSANQMPSTGTPRG
ncbi:glycosyltransferase family 2 protein [Kribbella sp. NPDC051137]|uniref:glycosyltransferase n=1 Tax=Kribbella sp. NPDC051137 TaxID=3155045 RepID=UPI002F4F662E